MRPEPHERYIREILSEVDAGQPVSQRSLSRRVGIALGLTNLLIRRMVRKGWVRMIKVKPNRVAYLLTPAGMTAKARLSCAYFVKSTRFYAEARDRILASFERMSEEWAEPGPKRLVFVGAGEAAEIGYICLQETDFVLAGVLDDVRTKPFIGLPIHRLEDWAGFAHAADGDVMFVPMSFEPPEDVEGRLIAAGIPLEKVYWI